MTNYVKPKFQLIRVAGQLNQGRTADGITVYRQEKLWVEGGGDQGRFVMCSPDDIHFVFIDPRWKKVPGRWFAYCSCGSIAVITGSKAYREYSSPTTGGSTKGEMLICKQFLDTGQHFPMNWSERG